MQIGTQPIAYRSLEPFRQTSDHCWLVLACHELRTSVNQRKMNGARFSSGTRCLSGKGRAALTNHRNRHPSTHTIDSNAPISAFHLEI